MFCVLMPYLNHSTVLSKDNNNHDKHVNDLEVKLKGSENVAFRSKGEHHGFTSDDHARVK